MIEEMILSLDCSGVVSVILFCVALSLQSITQVDNDARRSPGLHMSVNLPPVSLTLKRSVLVGCGLRLDRLLPRCKICLQVNCQV